MIFLGHAAGAYLLAQVPAVFGHPLPLLDQSLIFIAGNFLDIDLLYSKHIVKQSFNHHFSPTHTPAFATLVFLVFFTIFGHTLSRLTSLLILLSLLLHLVFDDISYWFTRVGLENSSPHPQIFWLYPFDGRRDLKNIPDHVPLSFVLKNYYLKAPWTFGFELVLTFSSLMLFAGQLKLLL